VERVGEEAGDDRFDQVHPEQFDELVDNGKTEKT
jgi:hypothetical protein